MKSESIFFSQYDDDIGANGALPVSRYRFTARVEQPLPLPDYAGSLLRGQFGSALREVACMTRQKSCPGCPLLHTCPYTRIFEAQPPPKGGHSLQDFSQIPNPYIMEPPAPGTRLLQRGDALVFHMVLVGHAIEQLALIIFALQRALAKGLTKSRVPVLLELVEHVDAHGNPSPLWIHTQPTLVDHPAVLNPSEAIDAMQNVANSSVSTPAICRKVPTVTLSIHTPMRLQHQGKPLHPGQLTPRTLIAALARRTALLMDFHSGPVQPPVGYPSWAEAAKSVTRTSEAVRGFQQLRWHDWVRYSSRQQQEMTLGGVVGRWTLESDDDTALSSLWPWLWLGQWLHVGKNATMGMGGYTLSSP